jgi:hypothetical protein
LQTKVLRIDGANAPASNDDIRRLETTLGHTLPDDFKRFLAQYNGGIPYNNTFDVPSAIYSKFLYSFVIARFMGINPKGQDDILRTRDNLKDQLPPGAIPVAIDRFRNFMCLLPGGDGVVFYDLQSALKTRQGDPKRPIAYAQYTYHVADNFTAMLDELYHRKFT